MAETRANRSKAAVFTRFVLGIDALQAIVDSGQCVRAAMNKVPGRKAQQQNNTQHTKKPNKQTKRRKRHTLRREKPRTTKRIRKRKRGKPTARKGCPRQAHPFSINQLRIFHTILKESEVWNQVIAGMILFCVYARARWSDAQHVEV